MIVVESMLPAMEEGASYYTPVAILYAYITVL